MLRLVTLSNFVLPHVILVTLCNPCDPVLACFTLVTLRYPVIPRVTLSYSVLLCVTLVTLCYPVLPGVTLVSLW